MKLDVRVLKNKILHCFKRRHSKKLCCERTSQFYICVYIQCRRRRLTDRLHLKFPFYRQNWRSRSSLFKSTDVVVVNFVVVFKFPVVQHATTIVRLVCLSDQLACFCFVFFFARVRVLAVKLQGNFKTFPSLPQAERLCSSSAKNLCALMIPLTTITDYYYGFCYASSFTSFRLFKTAFSIIITS